MSKSRIIENPKGFPIQPEMINLKRPFIGAFDDWDTEESARWIVRFFQKKGEGWAPFVYEDLDAFYSHKHQDGFRFNRLIHPEHVTPSKVPPTLLKEIGDGNLNPMTPVGGGWIVMGEDGKLRVTEDFVQRCHKSSPFK
ncbi:MAG: hypothetical protein UY41_C0008G0025 [Candidatus Moranbacteria bacterium GW2011_GWE1_49_15]|nr:MAG: hypothetical protein UX75_C0008G0020 [Candidatus Moranbacteria bacterium GW2011_GWE2_47_10]KKW07193.1 MAG: hypothetical protein UY41_C0008G0025 [Candidatus Moranbacteria bacterium GW2011_GWE1_49_15]HBP00771.1 hypothetical protein [Candidatus Moranbacteria bacterium]